MKKFITLVAATVMALSASANAQYYYNFVRIHSVPSGRGQVYASASEEVNDSVWTGSEVSELKIDGPSGYFYLHAKAIDGWQVAGFATTTLDDTGNPVYTENIFSTSNPAKDDITNSTFSGWDDDGLIGARPVTPNRVYIAHYTRVKAVTEPGFESIGSVSSNDPINDIGDIVTLTATPNTDYDPSAKFEYWVEESTGRKITEPEITVEVTGLETYTAHFTSDFVVTLDFPEEGGYKFFWNSRNLFSGRFPENVYTTSFQLIDSLVGGKRFVGAEPQHLGHDFLLNNTPAILYGTGQAKVLLSRDETANISADENLITAQQDFNVDTLSADYKYYTIDVDNAQFDLIQPGTLVAAGTHYIRLAASGFKADSLPTPEILYWFPDVDELTGVPYYYNQVQLHSLPAGAGQVYVSESAEESDTLWTGAEVADRAVDGASGSFYLHAKANDGWQVAGFAATTLGEDSLPVYTKELFSTSNPASADIAQSDYNGWDDDRWRGTRPSAPNRVYLALYTRVKPTTAAEFESLGSVSISPAVNNIGDTVTLTAIPDTVYDPTAKFDYWIEESTGRKITDPVISVEVNGVDTYTAYFTSDRVLTLDFPEEGGYKLFWSDRELSSHRFPDNVYTVDFLLIDSLADGKRYVGVQPQHVRHDFLRNNTPAVLYGTGQAKVLLSNDSTVNISELEHLITAPQEIYVDTLSADYKYYTIDVENAKFDLIQPGTVIAAGTHYIRFAVEDFKSGIEEAPVVLYWFAEIGDVVGISTVEASDARAAAGNDKIYTLGGMQVKRLGKGIYILNGKKVYNK